MIALRDQFEPENSLPGRVKAMFGTEGLARAGAQLRVPPRAAADGRRRGPRARRPAASGGRGGHRRRQIARLPRPGGHARAGDQEQGGRVHAHDQLAGATDLYKDIPILQKLLDAEFEAALFKGRQNYLCPRRLSRARQQATELFTGPEQSALEQIHYWSLKTTDGSLSDLPREPEHTVWAQVCSEAHICTPKSCGPDSGCFYQAARRKVNAAQIVVLNHALFFVLLGAAHGRTANQGRRRHGKRTGRRRRDGPTEATCSRTIL